MYFDCWSLFGLKFVTGELNYWKDSVFNLFYEFPKVTFLKLNIVLVYNF